MVGVGLAQARAAIGEPPPDAKAILMRMADYPAQRETVLVLLEGRIQWEGQRP